MCSAQKPKPNYNYVTDITKIETKTIAMTKQALTETKPSQIITKANRFK